MLRRIVGLVWIDEEATEDVTVSTEAVDTDEVALHVKGAEQGNVSLYVTREEAVTLGALLIAAAHSEPA